MFSSEKFVDYIITYTNHMPFNPEKGNCKMLLDLDSKDAENTSYDLTEEDCARRQAKETDYMIELLLKELKERELLDKTTIVVFTDHYLYTLSDKTILDKYKNTSNNLINHTPFFIYTNNKDKKTIKTVTSQLNILPTVLNLFGIEYNPNYYLGQDALGKNYIKSIHPVFPGMNFMPTGGIGADVEDITEWLKGGAIAVGLGSSLIKTDFTTKQLTEKVQNLLQQLNQN